MAEHRQLPPVVLGVRPGRVVAPTTSELVQRLAAGERDAVRPLRSALSRPFSRIAAALFEDRRGTRAPVATAITVALARVEEHPDGHAPLMGGAWDATGFGALTLEALMEQLGRTVPLRSPRMAGLDLQQRMLLLLVEVELLDTEDVAELFATDIDEVADHLEALREHLSLPDPEDSHCPVWNDVRVRHRQPPDEMERAATHLEVCAPCRSAMRDIDVRRDAMMRMVPGIGWSRLGYAVSARRRFA